MGFWSGNPNALSESREKSRGKFFDDIKKTLYPKDGKTHVIVTSTADRYFDQTYPTIRSELGYADAINDVIIGMQDAGYEIVDIKMNHCWDEAKMKSLGIVYTMIIYK